MANGHTGMCRRVAVVGLGMGSLPHLKSLADLSDRIEVVGAFSRSEERRRACAMRFGLPVTDDLERLIDDPSISAVVLLTPPNARLELVERFAKAGKHILMEKPVERTTAAASQIVDLCRRSGVTLGIVLQHRFRKGAEQLKEALAAGILGDIAAAHLVVPWWRPQSYYDEPGRGTFARDGGGVLISQAIHSLDLLLSLAGPVDEVAAITATTALHRMEAEDFVGAGLTFANGAVGALMATTALYPGGAERITIAGTLGTAHLESSSLEMLFLDGRHERFGEPSATGGGADPMAFPHDWHLALHRDFYDALDEGREPRIPGHEALHVHRLIDTLLQSAKERRTVSLLRKDDARQTS
jgi:UDP-N-acetyl-2-amino-2-deoxyglucuronate dehydrogenase